MFPKDDSSLWRRRPSVSRRQVLGSIGAVSLSGLAGCAWSSPPDESQPTTSGESVIRGTSFEGMDLVVELRDGHDVSRLNLIAPDGTLFSGAEVATGVRTVRLPILSIEAGGASKHYTPGTHELVAVVGDETRSHSIDLRPDLAITDIRQYREGSGGDYGKLIVTVENTGSAPTWIYSIVYEDAPNYEANVELWETPSIPVLTSPEDQKESIVYPSESQEYVSQSTPILFDDESQQKCNEEEIEMTIVVGVATTSSLQKQVVVRADGELVSAGVLGRYTCNRIRVDVREASE